ncbi:MAG: tetratricopeptide repeat protein [Bacteroides sp.]|nr:tetratricopeptide repeat protein [Bacteroides sp.]
MKKLFAFLCLCAGCSLLPAQNANPIQEAMANYDYETALSLIEQETPTIPLLYQKGKALKGLGYSKEALNVFQEIVAQDSLNPSAYIEMAECSKLQAQYQPALNYYKKALVLNPDNKYVHLQYICLLMSNKNYREGLKESALLAEKDSSAQALNLRAECTERILGPVLGAMYAIEAYQLIQKKLPDDYVSAARLGNTLINLAEYQGAILFTEQYRSRDTTNIIINRVNAQAYCLGKIYPTAIERYETLLQNGDSTFYTCLYASISYYATKDIKRAIPLFEKALQDNGSDINAHYYMGRSCARVGRTKEGVEHLEMVLEAAIPQDSVISRLYNGMVECYKADKRYKDQATALMEQYERYAPDHHILLYNAAYVYYYRLNNIPKAKQLLAQFLKTRPKESKENKQEKISKTSLEEPETYEEDAPWTTSPRNMKRPTIGSKVY